MKKICQTLITITCLMLFCTVNCLAGTPKIFAVVVGISHYKDENIPNLKFPEKDAQAFYDFLQSPYSGSIPKDNIALLLGANATRSNIIKEVVDIFKRSTKDDMIIFYFSGHGKGDESDNAGYLLSYDSENDNEAATALSMDELKSKIDRTNAKLKVSYVDACHAGLFKSYNAKGGTVEDNEIIASAYMQSVANAGGGNIAFLASSARQQSLEDDKLGDGVFTYYLLKGLKGDADKVQKDAEGYNDGLVTVGELSTYLTDKIPAATKYKQKPTIDGSYDEEFPLSILRSNVQIASEIAKRPEKKASKTLKASLDITPTLIDTATVYMPKDEWGGPIGHSPLFCKQCFINNYKEDILLYFLDYNGNNYHTSMLIAKGDKNCGDRIPIGDNYKDVKFFFKTVDESKPIKYGTMTLTVEVGKIKTQVLSTRNLYLSTNGEKKE